MVLQSTTFVLVVLPRLRIVVDNFHVWFLFFRTFLSELLKNNLL